VLSGKAVERITSALDELVVTDTIPLREAAKACPKIRQLSVAGLLAETMLRISNEDSAVHGVDAVPYLSGGRNGRVATPRSEDDAGWSRQTTEES
jgi:hypothetical protein